MTGFWLLMSCSSVKFVGDNERLLDRVTIHSDNEAYPSETLKPYLRQQPNFKSFGLLRWQLHVYGWSGRNPDRWLNKQLRKMGEAPVIMDTTLVVKSVEDLERYMVNKGYVQAKVHAAIDTSRRKKARVTYSIISNEPCIISSHVVNLKDERADSIARLQSAPRTWLSATLRTSPDDYVPLVKPGDLFDRDMLDKERLRITSLMRRNGYYAFRRENLGYMADSSSNKVELEMRMFPNRRIMPDGSIRETAHRPYYIKDVTIRTDYDPLRPSESLGFVSDTVRTRSLSIIYGQNGRTLRPSVLREHSYIVPGEPFDERSVDRTYSALSAMSALRNTTIRFEETEENDSLKLSALILTTPAKTHGFGVDIEGTNSAGDFGAAASANYRHRNLFHGSESFAIKIRGAYEALTGMDEFGQNNYWEIGGEASLSFPRILFPFINEQFRRTLNAVAATDLRVSYNRQTRPEYERAVLSGRWGYNWQNRVGSSSRHNINLVNIDYLFLPRISLTFLESLPEATRQYHYVEQFIMSAGYTYSFNNYDPQYRRRNTQSVRASFELAGNFLNLMSRMIDAPRNSNGKYVLFGIEYSQYAKLDLDFGKGVVIDDRNRLAFHLGLGLAAPYGNASKIPFERRYFSGGANSVRGWSVRTLGPGSMSKDSVDFIRQAGDIRLDANIEYRSKLMWNLELALFADAGNIWTIKPYAEQYRGNFDFQRFYKEIAVSYGLGLRLDFDFAIFRLDFGFKAYDPQAESSRRWAISRPNLRDNFAWHFGV
ncbi:MAG: BamA/TamA family outer membrane protein, partial [Tannerellaceae bacterium]|nr:BamA/TamA family outer membrane protein [Tannerellaceae bacterium]